MTWAMIMIFNFVAPILLAYMAAVERRMKKRAASVPWAKGVNSAWYTFGTFLGESMVSLEKDKVAWPLKYVNTTNWSHIFILKLFLETGFLPGRGSPLPS